MSKPDVWMPLYVADYLADTGHLSAIEHGAYLMLIMHYWRNGGLPIDDEKLARISRCTPKEWAAIKATISEFFDIDWRHHRIDAELASAESAAERARENGKRGGRPRKLNPGETQKKPNPFQNKTQTEPRHEPKPNPEKSSSPSPSDSNVSSNDEPLEVLAPLAEPQPTDGEKPHVQRNDRRGTRLAPDWQPDQSLLAFATGLGLDPGWELGKFRDFWASKPGKDGLKLDWSGTFRNWCRSSAERLGGRSGGSGQRRDRAQPSGMLATAFELLAEAEVER